MTNAEIAKVLEAGRGQADTIFLSPPQRQYLACHACHGSGTVPGQIGGDGFAGRCCAVHDVELQCSDCGGTGIVEVTP